VHRAQNIFSKSRMKSKTNSDLEILYEDNHLICINKKCGEIVQPDLSGDPALEERVKEYIKVKYFKPGNVFLGVAHRIDRPVSGVVMFARTSKALARINEMFKEKTIKKTYWAIVKNKPDRESGSMQQFLLRNSRQNKSYIYDKAMPGSKLAILHYRIIASSNSFFLLEIDLETGRHHQIRAQLSAIGSPIRGDLKYGFDRSNPDGGINLHARSIELFHPVTKEKIQVIAQPPKDKLWDVFMNCL
jgi:23S rRNA pseudouridine1911/1915/1917 synthase